MDNMIVDMKPIMRVSKHGLRSIIGRMLDYSQKYEYTYSLDTQKCSVIKCPLLKSYESLKETIALEKKKEVPDASVIANASSRMKEIASSCAASSCPFCNVTKTYVNDRKRYNMYNEDFANRRLPKSMIRTYLYLYSLPQEVLGGVHFIRNISINILSSELGLCRETIKRSIETLASFHYIAISHASSLDEYNIIINDYDTMHLPANRGGTGYLTLSSAMMKAILSISNVNALRLELLKLLKSDDDSLRGIEVSEYQIKDLGNMMPSHTNYPGRYKNLLSKQPSLFVSNIQDGRLYFSLKNGYSLRLSSDEFVLSYLDVFKAYTASLALNLDSDTLLNICELTREYTISNIKYSLSLLAHDFTDAMHEINNFGALLRSYCRRNFIHSAA